MSYIDTFDHKFVGFFAHRHVYWPTATVAKSFKDEEFGCNPNCVIIGGGSGEDPAVICSSPSAAILQFIISWKIAICPEGDTEMKTADKAVMNKGGSPQAWDQFIEASLNESLTHALHFPGWGVEDYTEFQIACSGQALRAPFNSASDGGFETWLLANIGELIIFGLPNLAEEIQAQIGDLKSIVQPLYGNFLCIPSGYPVPGGREVRGDKVVWGVGL